MRLHGEVLSEWVALGPETQQMRRQQAGVKSQEVVSHTAGTRSAKVLRLEHKSQKEPPQVPGSGVDCVRATYVLPFTETPSAKSQNGGWKATPDAPTSSVEAQGRKERRS